MSVVDTAFGHPLILEEKATMTLAGGIAAQGYQCGMLWGAALASGAQVYRLHGSGPEAEAAAILSAQRLVEVFRARTRNEINCLEITDLNWKETNQILPILKFFIKGGPIGCFHMAARYAPEAYGAINSALSEKHGEPPSSPVSCTGLLARKMGLSDMQIVMAAGLAGGIGLSGGACGALGAIIWLKGLSQPVEIEGLSYSGTWVDETIEKFLESSDYEFECSKIVGRQFENTDEHADYLCAGGCSELIERLAVS